MYRSVLFNTDFGSQEPNPSFRPVGNSSIQSISWQSICLIMFHNTLSFTSLSLYRCIPVQTRRGDDRHRRVTRSSMASYIQYMVIWLWMWEIQTLKCEDHSEARDNQDSQDRIQCRNTDQGLMISVPLCALRDRRARGSFRSAALATRTIDRFLRRRYREPSFRLNRFESTEWSTFGQRDARYSTDAYRRF